EILKIRKYQVLSNTYKLLVLERRQRQQLRTAAQVLAHNLNLHGHCKIADQLLQEPEPSESDIQLLRENIQDLMRDCELSYTFKNERRIILGLAGLQYREFFTSLLPFYKTIGVEGAEQCWNWLQNNQRASESLQYLQKHYQNRRLIREA